MKPKLKISVFLAGIIFTAITIGAVLMVMLPLQEKFRADAENSIVKIADTIGLFVEGTVNYPAFFLRSNAAYTELIADGSISREDYVKHIVSLVEDAPFLSSFWYIFTPDGFDFNGHRYIGTEYGDDVDGRLFHGIAKRQADGSVNYINFSMVETLQDPLYIETFRAGTRWLTPPYREFVTLIDEPVDTITVNEPLYASDGRWLGTMGVDMYLDFLHIFISGFDIFDTGYVVLTTEDGTIIHSPNPDDWMKNTNEIGFDSQSTPVGGVFGNINSTVTGADSLMYTMPIRFELVEDIYYLSVIVPLSEINADANRIMVYFIIGASIILVLFTTLLFYLSWSKNKIQEHAKAAETRLTDENAALERLSRMKSEYLANISHETKTPLTLISVNVQMAADLYSDYAAEDGEDGKIISDALYKAQDAILRVGRITDNNLRLASMQESREKMTVLDISKLLISSAEIRRNITEKQGCKLLINIPDALPSVHGNADNLIQVMDNLLANARNHAKSDEISVNAKADEQLITVSVKDNGAGIPTELLPRVFERGVSGSDGTGIGLALCKQIIEAHGGEITANSDERGTTVTFTLPIYNEERTVDNNA